MTPHAEREHEIWSASSTAANWTCSGRIAMATLVGEEKESEHAARGTAAHTVAERCLRKNVEADTFIGQTIKTKQHEIEIDQELADSAQTHVDYVRSLSKAPTAHTFIEQKFSLAKLDPPFGAGGTCDAIIVHADSMEVVDLKNGMGVVDVNENKQLRTYALCALLNAPSANVKTITSTVVQPRAPHKDGRIRSETYHVADLIDWTVDLLARMRLSKQALTEFEALDGSRIAFDAWAEKWLTTGACTFCPAEGICPKRRKEALSIMGDTAKRWFEEPTTDDPLIVGNAPDIASPEELAHWLDGLEALENWIKAVRGYAHGAAERGVDIPNWMIVDKIGNRAWMEKDEAKLAAALKATLKLTDDQVYERSVRSVAQIEKVLGAKRKEELAALDKKLWEKPVKGTNLVSEGKTSRPAAKGLTERHHEKLEN